MSITPTIKYFLIPYQCATHFNNFSTAMFFFIFMNLDYYCLIRFLFRLDMYGTYLNGITNQQ